MTPQSLSVVIPTYNRRSRLEDCLGSVFGQTRPAEEVIVVDDGSTDGTADWIRGAFPKVLLIRQENRGVSAARNAGIRAASSEWIAFLDSDDVWLPDKTEKQLSALRDHPDSLICHTEERWLYRGQEKPVPARYRKRGGWIFEHCLPLCALSPSTVILRKQLFDAIGLFDETLPACEDYDLWLRIASRYPVLLVDESLIEKHGGHEDQLSNQRGLDSYRVRALQKILETGSLAPDHAQRAIETLRSKCEILIQGCEKRGQTETAQTFRRIRESYRADPQSSRPLE